MSQDVYIFGIRHHGPGSAHSLRQALEHLGPDIVLVEGPPDADALVQLAAHPAMVPPVALLVYVPEQPRRAVYYPFALFSPEWQAIQYALSNHIPVRFMDLPQTHLLAIEPDASPHLPSDEQQETAHAESTQAALLAHARPDPLGWLAEAAGYSDGERWWEHMVEQRRDAAGLFDAVLEAMAALRESMPAHDDPSEGWREAWMRQTIRFAQQEGFRRIAVVCGAWHAPALRVGSAVPSAKADAMLLKGLAKIKTQTTWVPWTYGRLSFASGYGAGIESPGWYEHLWQTSALNCTPVEVAVRWMTKVARLLRCEDLDASAAHVIEAVRLAESLAAIRDRPLPGLPELADASQAVFCFGTDMPMRLIHMRLIVGELLGQVPDTTPMVPLQQDLQREQKRLRLPAEASWRDYDFDLRKQNDLERSHLLHRLNLLDIPWGRLQHSGGGKGTFHELWRLEWHPELAVRLIEASSWGNTIYDAATRYTCDTADRTVDLPTLTALVDRALLADLPDAVALIMERLQNAAALASDVTHLMEALPPLANVLRYGNVRRTDAAAVGHVIDGLVARICIGLPGACASLDDAAALAMFERLMAVNGAIALLHHADHAATWKALLRQMADQHGLHGLIAGRCCRILLDEREIDADDATRRLGLALSSASTPAQAAAWIEGMLKGSGLVLLHDRSLWRVLDRWVAGLTSETFTHILPLLRRTFATFAPAERRQMGERARFGESDAMSTSMADRLLGQDFDPQRAATVLPLVAQLLGLQTEAGINRSTEQALADLNRSINLDDEYV